METDTPAVDDPLEDEDEASVPAAVADVATSALDPTTSALVTVEKAASLPSRVKVPSSAGQDS